MLFLGLLVDIIKSPQQPENGKRAKPILIPQLFYVAGHSDYFTH